MLSRELIQALDGALAADGWQRVPAATALHWRFPGANGPDDLRIVRQGRTRYAGEVRVRQMLGFRLRIDLGTSIKTHLFFVRAGFAERRWVRWIYRWRRQIVIRDVPAALSGFSVVARDAVWASHLLADREVVDAVATLLKRHASNPLAGSVHFGPGSLHFASPILQPGQLAPENVVDARNTLQKIAERCSRLPPVSQPIELTSLERFAKQNPMAFAIALMFGLIALLGIFGVLLLAIAMAVFTH